MFRSIFYGGVDASFLRRNFVNFSIIAIWIAYIGLGPEHPVSKDYLIPAAATSLFVLPFSLFFAVKWSSKANLVRKRFGADMLQKVSFKELEKLSQLAAADTNELDTLDTEYVLLNLDDLVATYSNTVVFVANPVTVTEVLINLVTCLFLYPTLFLFQSKRSRNVKVGVVPEDLLVAKILTVFTGGLYWQYLRYFATVCPQCNARDSLELVDSQHVSSHLESYTDKQTTVHRDASGRTIGTSETPIQKIRTVTISDNTYECKSCHGQAEVREQT